MTGPDGEVLRITRDEKGRYMLHSPLLNCGGQWPSRYYRTRSPFASRYAWTRLRRAAARFRTRADARAVAEAYARGEDLAPSLAVRGTDPRIHHESNRACCAALHMSAPEAD